MASPTNRFMQFSVREVLIAMVAIAAILALVVSHLPFTPSDFITTLDEEAALKKVCAELGIPLTIEGNSGLHSLSWNNAKRETVLTMAAPDMTVFTSQILPSLRDHIEALLLEQGATIDGYSLHGSIAKRSLKRFGFYYQLGSSRGEVRFYCFGEDGQAVLMILTEES